MNSFSFVPLKHDIKLIIDNNTASKSDRGQNYLKESEKNDEKKPLVLRLIQIHQSTLKKRSTFRADSYVCRFFALAEDHDDIKPMQ